MQKNKIQLIKKKIPLILPLKRLLRKKIN